jgi:hypothetical protein
MTTDKTPSIIETVKTVFFIAVTLAAMFSAARENNENENATTTWK